MEAFIATGCVQIACLFYNMKVACAIGRNQTVLKARHFAD
jgi:hypothetical protein